MMQRNSCARGFRRALLSSVATVVVAAPASAQTAGSVPPPTRYVLDENGVNLATGEQFLTATELSIGNGEASLALRSGRGISGNGSGYLHYIYANGTTWSASVPADDGARTYRFTLSSGSYTSTTGEPATLVNTAAGYVLTLPDGMQYTYGETGLATGDGNFRRARLTRVVSTDGAELRMTFRTVTYCSNNLDNCQNGRYITKIRLQSVRSSYGYQLQYSYANNNALTAAGGTNWDRLISVTAFNLGVDFCAPDAATCTFSQAWPTASYATTLSGYDTIETVTAAGKTTRYTSTSGSGIPTSYKIRRPGSTADNMTTVMVGAYVGSVNNDGRITNYSWSLSGNLMTTTITNPDSTTRTVVSDVSVGLPTRVTDEKNRVTQYAYDARGRLIYAVAPEGNRTEYSYNDATQRGNLVETRLISKNPGTPATIVTTAGYPLTCASPKSCNRPVWTRDSSSAQTDYEYDLVHGGLTKVISPAVIVNGSSVRPAVRYGYTALQAYYKEASGAIVASGVNAYRVTSTSSCQMSASCANAADEARLLTSYGPQAAGTRNNLLPLSTTSGSGAAFSSGDSANLATVTNGYDAVGNLVSVDGPVLGTADTTTYRYDAARQLVGVIGPDPDGGGSLQRPATKATLNDASQPTLVETGTVAGTTDADWGYFQSLQQRAITYDSSARPIVERLTASGVTYAVTQTSYDSRSRVECSAVRMNDTVWASLPASACDAQVSGAAGPDRVTRRVYTAAGEVGSTISAYGLADESTETMTYTLNGLPLHVVDAKGNATRYDYDGFDRLARTVYPSASVPGDTNPADYEEFGYDANGNVLTKRTRDGHVMSFGYDALNRLTSYTKPSTSGVYWETNRGYAYDLLGRMTQASDSNGRVLSFGYDALGRRTSQGDNWYAFGNASFQYDAAGRRTRMTWTDGNYVSYEYANNAGAMTAIRENGGTVLASFAYDSLGRRTSLTRANGTVTNYSYDPVSRLATLGHTMPGSPYWNVDWSFAYNPAGQIASSTRSHDGYAWAGHYNVDRSYGVNGLNQLTSAGPTPLGYDGRGNLITSGPNSFSYTADNQMTVANGIGLPHDPLGRLFHIAVEGNVAITLSTDGPDVIAETDVSNGVLARRYVWGPGTDEPLVWYEGAGLADRRFLHADERGSIVAVTNNAGAALAINRYDEFGIPQAGNVGRFQYTGQKWLPTAGLYDYKARMYSPTLGRFMQTDPIGYGDGMNWYNYVGSDPVNQTDPSGLAKTDLVVVGLRRKDGGNLWPGGMSGRPSGGDIGGGGVGDDAATDQTAPELVVNGVRPKKTKYVPGISITPQNNQSKPLPPCLQRFLKGRLKSNPANIRLHQGSPFELTGNSVTFGNDVYLAGDSYGRSDRRATIHKFHEIQHTSQYARGYSALNQAFAYVAFGGHDASPFEQAADTFAQDTYNDYKAAGLDKSCPF